jgi:hypothetical protein
MSYGLWDGLKRSVRGKYYREYREGTNPVLLDADVAALFRHSTAVNQGLRLLIKGVAWPILLSPCARPGKEPLRVPDQNEIDCECGKG